jgi:hypothetical protein
MTTAKLIITLDIDPHEFIENMKALLEVKTSMPL